ncbi:MAG: V-type ATPase 116kDa subunit family protein [Candidatus Omnitrophica bacterium]|nr:V-type ATPase 116kDa subunit family protein [Candidatus Omnitrophota bacterium]
MLTASSMELLSMVVFKEKSEEVISRLLKLGLFHPVDIRNINKELKDLSPLEIEKEHGEWEAIEITLREILRKLNLALYHDASKDITSFSYAEIKGTLSDVENKLAPLVDQRDELLEELKTKESILSQIKEYFPLPIKRDSFYTFLEVALGKIEEKNIQPLERSLKGIPYLIYPLGRQEQAKEVVLVIGLRRDRALIDKILKDLSWEKIEYPQEMQELPADVEKKIRAQIEDCRKKLEDTQSQMKDLAQSSKSRLSSIQSFIILKKTLLEAKRYSCATEKTVILSGWVPREDKEKVIREIKKIDRSFYIEGKNAEEIGIPKEDIPVRLQHSPFFKPFELLVDSYGLPRYGTVDPTIFVAMSFLLMFGAMFGDLGQGLVLALAGLFLRRSKKEGVRQSSILIFYCGISAAIFGVLYGSVFGFEFPSLWMRPMSNVMEFFKLSIYFGIGIISLGIIINIINALRDKDYIKAVFDKAGLIVGVIYWLVIAVVSKYLASKTPASPLFIGLIGAGLFMLFLKPVIGLISRKNKENILMSFMESTIEIFEIFIGYLSNTVSFMRIAAYAVTHASLFLAIFELSRALKGAGFIVIILGNIMIILLEGLVASIQSIRLNYYEFFSKFFMAGKQTFKPLTTQVKE